MSRFLRLAVRASLFAVLVAILLNPQVGQGQFIPADPPSSCPTSSCPTCPPNPCVQQETYLNSSISLTEGNADQEYSSGQARSGFGITLALTISYNTYDADGSRNMFTKQPGQIDTVMGYGWTHVFNDLLFTQHNGDMFRLAPDGRITRFALQTNGTYQTSPGYFETLVKNNDGSFDLTTKYQTDYHYAAVPNTPFFLGTGPVMRLMSITDRNNNVTSLTYDATGDMTTVTDTYGRTYTYGYNSNHHVSSATDPLGRTTTFGYDTTGHQLTTIVDPNGKTTTYTYDTSYHHVTAKTDRDGRLFTYTYQNRLPYSELDSAGNPFYSLTNLVNWAVNLPQTWANYVRVYTPSTTSKTDGRGNVWQYSYDSNAHPLTVTAPDGTVTTYTYDPGTLQVASITDANGHTTSYGYDTQGNMLSCTDALGHTTTYTYDPTFNQMLSMTDPQGRVTTYTIDGHGNRTGETDPLGGTANWTYDSHGNVTSSTDKDRYTTNYVYDSYGNLVTLTDPLNEVTSYTNDIMGNRLSMTDADGNLTKYQYDLLDRLVLATDALNDVKQYFYDNEGDKTEVVDENGHATSYTYDLRQRLVTVTDALGGTITYTYDGNNNKLTMTDQNGHTTRYTYDVQNRLIEVTDPLLYNTMYTYDGVGNLMCQTDADGHQTCYVYDQLNRRTQRTDALHEVTTWNYDMTGLGGCPTPPGPCTGPTLGSSLVTEQTDGNGKIIYYAYDGLDRLIIEDHKQGNSNHEIDPNDAVMYYTYDPNSNRLVWQQPDGNVMDYTYDKVNRRLTMVQVQTGDTTTWTYDPFGNVHSITAPDLNVTTYTYDPLNRRISEIDSDGPVSTTSYDAVGNVIGTTDGDGNLTTYNYDGLNRRTTVTDPLDKATQYFYDPVGNLLRVLDRNGNPTTYTYDADNRRITITDAQPATTTFQYDPVGNLTSITDANGHITFFGYDAVNRKISETYPDLSNNTVNWTYDMVGNVMMRTDQKLQVTNYAYSDLYFLLSRSYPSGVDSFTYDLSGRVLTGNTTRGFGWNESFQYDGSDRLIQSVQNSKTISYVYNIPGRTRTLTYPGGRSITEQWDYRPRLMNVNDGGQTTIAQYAYDAANNVLTRGYRNGTVATATYNANNWVCSLQHSSGANLIVGFTYAYDNEGNKFYEQKLHELGRSEAYTYDSVYRLTDYQVGQLSGSPPPDCPGALGVQMPVTQTSYNLDKLGNWNSKDTDSIIQTRTHSPSNEISSINTTAVVSDFNGNTTTYGPDGYSYDEENRLTKATFGPHSTLGQYQYDTFGRRVSKIDNVGVQTLYYYDGWRTIEEQSSAGVTQATYVFGNYLDEALTMDRGGHTYYYHQNALWSVYALSNSSGVGIEGYYYDAYGYQTVVLPGEDGILDFDSDDVYVPGARSSVGNPFLFTGQRFDPETGLLYYKNRHYSTSFGRFMQRDSTDYDAGDTNLYEYVNGRPTNSTDSTGAAPDPDPPGSLLGPNFSSEFWKKNAFQRPEPPTYAVSKTIEDLTRALDDDDFDTREKAATKLLELGQRDASLKRYLVFKLTVEFSKPAGKKSHEVIRRLTKIVTGIPSRGCDFDFIAKLRDPNEKVAANVARQLIATARHGLLPDEIYRLQEALRTEAVIGTLMANTAQEKAAAKIFYRRNKEIYQYLDLVRKWRQVQLGEAPTSGPGEELGGL
jgi:RHS repeat-associated protein